MAEIETVLVRDFPSLETPTNNRKHGAKLLNTSSSASTLVETPSMANDDSPDTLRVRAISTEGKPAKDILKDLDTPPRNNNRGSFLSNMTEQFPSPAVPNGILSPSMSEVTAPSAFKESNRSFVSPNDSEIDFSSTNQSSLKPNLLFREKDTKRAIDFSSGLKSRSPPARNPVLPVHTEAESEKKPMARKPSQIHDTPESQPGRIIPGRHIRDDESCCASSVCPFDCVDYYADTSVPTAPEEMKKENGFIGFFKKSSSSNQRSIPESEAVIHQTVKENEYQVEIQGISLNGGGRRDRMEMLSKLFGIFSKSAAFSEHREQASMPGNGPNMTLGPGAKDQAVDARIEIVDLEEGRPNDNEFTQSLSKGAISNEHPVDEPPTQISSSGQIMKGSPKNPGAKASGGTKNFPDLDETVGPGRSYNDDDDEHPQERPEQTKRYAKTFVFYIFVPALVLSLIILASILVKRMTNRESSLSVTSQTFPPTNGYDFEDAQTQRPIDVPPFFDNTRKLCKTARQLTETSATYDSMSRVAWDNTINACGDSLEFGFATWYTVSVDESTFMESSTCNAADFDTQITIMSGDCEGLSCVTFSDNECGAQSRATWYAEKGKSYFVIVSGYREEWGEYTLSLNPTTINDKCHDASSSLTIGSTVFGTTSGATTEDLPSCGDVDTTKPGVWYEVSNVDGPVHADVFGRWFNFMGQISVYDGSCDVLSCAAGSKVGSVTWDAIADSTYHVYVNGAGVDGDFDLSLGRDNKDSCNEDSSLQPSNFAYISTTRDARQQDVESCGFDGRQHSAPGKWFSLIGTGNEFKVSTCSTGVDLDTEVSLFMGTCGSLQCVGGTGRALPCGEGGAISWKTEPDSMYYIYVSGRGSRVGDFWLTIEETELAGSLCTEHVALGAFATGSIKRSIDVMPAEPVPIEGSIGFARGIWYELIGTGNLVEMTVCGLNNRFDGIVSVSTGDCSDPTYLGQTSKCGEDGDSIKFVSTIGQKYQVFIHGSDDESTGEFTLNVKHYDELNDRCALALPLETVTGVYPGSTKNAIISDAIDVVDVKNTIASTPYVAAEPTSTPTQLHTIVPTSASSALPTETPKKGGKDKKEKEDKNNKDHRKMQEIVDSCNYIPRTYGLWYKVDGSGGDIVVSTCSEDTNFDTAIDIFTGGCGDLQCIASNDDGCGSQSLVRFPSEIGVAYYIQVRGIDESEVGDFSLSVTVRDPYFGV